MSDEKNPEFTFNMTDTEILLGIATGKLDPVQMAKRQLAGRGVGKDGEWIGFEAARKLWNA